MDIRRWGRAVIGGAVLLALLIGAAWNANAIVRARADDVAVLAPLQGMVQVWSVGGERWVTLSEAATVGAGDMARTDSAGLAVLVFFEGVEIDILPNSVLIIDELSVQDAPETGPFAISVGVLAGETLHRVGTTLDAESRYMVHTPSATVAVRGTVFWTSAYPMGETQVRVLDGVVTVTAVAEDGREGDSVVVEAGHLVTTFPGGTLGEVLPLSNDLPAYPENAPLALASCGNGICEQAESDSDSCPLDCMLYSNCGDGLCDWIEGENATVCPTDCAQNVDIPGIDLPEEPVVFPPEIPGEGLEPVENRLHFLWATMSCEYSPSNRISGPLLTHWGIGCFDSMAHASAHPHPGDYQMYLDGEPVSMASLRQSGPHLHPPYCPWGWSFEFGPLTLTPGAHTLRLVETVTDTWSGESGGRNAGEVVELVCTFTVLK